MKKLNIKLDNLLRQKIEAKDFEITFKELESIGIQFDENELILNENTYLKKVHYFLSYHILFKDKQRNYDNKILDAFVDKKYVIKALSEYRLTKSNYEKIKKNRQSEVEWNKDLELFLKKHFLTVKKGNPRKSLEVDLDIGYGKVGIELKWADKINKNHPMHDVYGQIGGYYKNGNYNSLILCVAGFQDLKQDVFLLQLQKMIKDDFNCEYLYVSIV
jgi:hypothetical protein